MREQHGHSSIHLSIHDLPRCLLTVSYLAGPSGLGKDSHSERSRFCPCLCQWQYPLPFRYRRMSSSHRCRRCHVRRRPAIQHLPFRSSTIPFLPAVPGLTSYFRHGSSPAIRQPCPRVSSRETDLHSRLAKVRNNEQVIDAYIEVVEEMKIRMEVSLAGIPTAFPNSVAKTLVLRVVARWERKKN
jgi:hypothetical protein